MVNYGSDGEVNKNISINIKKVLVPQGATPYDVNGAKDSHDFALVVVLEKNFDEVEGWGLGKQL